MNINSILGQLNESINLNSQNISNAPSAGAQQGANSIDILNNLTNGSFVNGEILEVKGDAVAILLGDNQIVNAKLENAATPTVGTNMSFVVSQSSGNQISLTPLFENISQMSTVNSALNAAGLPDNPKMQYMVKTMMQEGLPIDKQSLYDMNRAVISNPESDIASLSQMHRLNLPLSTDMVSQFENYINLKQEISGTISDVSSSFLDIENFEGFIGDIDVSLAFAKSEVGNYIEIMKEFIGSMDSSSIVDEDILPSTESMETSSRTIKPEDDVKSYENLNRDKNINDLDLNKDNSKNVNESSSNQKNSETIANTNVSTFNKNIALKIEEFSKAIENIKTKEDLNEVLNDIKNTIGNKDFKEQFNRILLNKYQLTPEDVGKDGEVSKTFNKMNDDFKNLLNELTNMGKADTPVGKAVSNVNSNIDFMNHLNQTFNYVQIPLKMLNQDASGELYVYSKKRSLAKEDGSVSALLHLDMDNLGPVDVHVSLNEFSNVKTKFYLKDDASLDLIAQNIEVLNQRLEKRGYSMSSEFINKDDDKTVIETILDDNKNISLISSNSFDARA